MPAKKRRDPKVGTGKKPKGSGRRLYTDENPKDTVSIKYATIQDAKDTVAKVKKISKNNTLVMFQPSNDTLHAIKLDYDHTKFQRTQIYGNLMYTNPKQFKKITWRDL